MTPEDKVHLKSLGFKEYKPSKIPDWVNPFTNTY